jgi:hypothetical protein
VVLNGIGAHDVFTFQQKLTAAKRAGFGVRRVFSQKIRVAGEYSTFFLRGYLDSVKTIVFQRVM